MKHLLILLVLLTSVVACAPAPEIVATAMAQTEAAMPTYTPIPTSTATFTPTPEPPTSTPTPTPTSTPDLQVITSNPKDMVCASDDLPKAGIYIQGQFTKLEDLIFIGSHLAHQTNDVLMKSNLASIRPLLEEYISLTGRMDGWWLDFKRSNNGYSGYKVIQCSLEKFQTIAGAQLAVQNYNDVELINYEERHKYLEVNQSIGDTSIAISYVHSFYDVNGEYFENKFNEVVFSYRNYRVTLIGHGDPKIDDLFYVGEQILKKLKIAPLTSEL